jgi:hypothetical protein
MALVDPALSVLWVPIVAARARRRVKLALLAGRRCGIPRDFAIWSLDALLVCLSDVLFVGSALVVIFDGKQGTPGQSFCSICFGGQYSEGGAAVCKSCEYHVVHACACFDLLWHLVFIQQRTSYRDMHPLCPAPWDSDSEIRPGL